MDMQITERYSKVDLFSIKGRMGKEYYLFYSSLIPLIFSWLFFNLFNVTRKVTGETALLPLSLLLVLAFLILFHFTVQRCHDFDKSGWNAIFVFIPFANLIYALIPNTNGLNRYGEMPEPAPVYISLLNYILIALLFAEATILLLYLIR